MDHLSAPASAAAQLGVRHHRSCHLIDIENVLEGDVTAARVDWYWRIHGWLAAVEPSDQVVLGSGVRAAADAWFAFPPWVRRAVSRGRHGGERALLRSLEPAHVAGRFERLVIASGDRALAPLAATARRLGLVVDVIANPGSLSPSLRVAATRVLWLPPANSDAARSAAAA